MEGNLQLDPWMIACNCSKEMQRINSPACFWSPNSATKVTLMLSAMCTISLALICSASCCVQAGTEGKTREAILQVSVAVLAAFCRVSEIIASQHILSVIPLMPLIMSKLIARMLLFRSGSSVVGDCLEILVLVSDAQENSLKLFYTSEGMQLLASQFFTLPDGLVEMALKLVQMIISKLPAENVYTEHPSELAMIVVSISQKFESLHSALKFEALHTLSLIPSSTYLFYVYEALK